MAAIAGLVAATETLPATQLVKRWGENSNCNYISVTEDTYLDQGVPNYNMGMEELIRVGDDGSRIDRTLIKFDFSDIPITSSNQIVSAYLKVKTYDNPDAGNITVDAFRVLKPWNGGGTFYGTASDADNEATWTYQYYDETQWTGAGCDNSADRSTSSDGTQTFSANNTWYTWDVTNSVKTMFSNSQYYGWILKCQSEATTKYWRIYSANNATSANRPYLEITYTPTNKITTLRRTSARELIIENERAKYVWALCGETYNAGNLIGYYIDPSSTTNRSQGYASYNTGGTNTFYFQYNSWDSTLLCNLLNVDTAFHQEIVEATPLRSILYNTWDPSGYTPFTGAKIDEKISVYPKQTYFSWEWTRTAIDAIDNYEFQMNLGVFPGIPDIEYRDDGGAWTNYTTSSGGAGVGTAYAWNNRDYAANDVYWGWARYGIGVNPWSYEGVLITSNSGANQPFNWTASGYASKPTFGYFYENNLFVQKNSDQDTEFFNFAHDYRAPGRISFTTGLPWDPYHTKSYYFWDKFETGDFSKWNSETDTGDDLTVNTSTYYSDQKALQLVINDTSDHYVVKSSIPEETYNAKCFYRVRFMFKLSSDFAMGTGHRFRLIDMGGNFWLDIKESSGNIQFVIGGNNNTPAAQDSAGYTISKNAWYNVEAYFEKVYGDAYQHLYLNNTEVAASPSCYRNSFSMAALNLGAKALDSGTSGTLWIDDLVISRDAIPVAGYDPSDGSYGISAGSSYSSGYPGIEFDLDGSSQNRYNPVFKVNHWTTFSGPVYTIEGSQKTKDTDYLLELAPISDADFMNDNSGVPIYTDIAEGGDTSGYANYYEYLSSTSKNFTFTMDEAATTPNNATPDGDAVYFGFHSKFYGLNIDLNTNGAGGNGEWQYWNGSSWVDIITVNETVTNAKKLYADGAVYWNEADVGSWARYLFNTSKEDFPYGTNVAQASNGGQVWYASEEDATNVKGNIIDGNWSTCWQSSAYSWPQPCYLILSVNSETSTWINRIKIGLGQYYPAKDATFSYSTDSASKTDPNHASWVKILTTQFPNNSIRDFTFNFDPVQAKYIRIRIDSGYSTDTVAIDEIAVYKYEQNFWTNFPLYYVRYVCTTAYTTQPVENKIKTDILLVKDLTNTFDTSALDTVKITINQAPSTPTIDNYNTGAWTNDNTPTLQFDLSDPDSGDIVKYQIQIDLASSYPPDWTGLTVDYTETSGSTSPRANVTYTPSALSDSTSVYYWRVRAKDDDNVEGSWATASSGFKVDTTAPAAPTTVTPSPTSYTATNSFSFSWTAPSDTSGINHYHYSVNAVPTSGSPSTAGTSVSAYAAATQQGANTFYVVAEDNAGNINYSNYGTGTFYYDTTAPTTPGTPTTTTPTNDTTPTWTWTASTDANSGLRATNTYIIYWDTTAGGTTNSAYTTTNSYTHTVALAQGTWYVKVIAYDAVNNASTASGNGSVLIDTTAPTNVGCNTPANGATGLSTGPTLTSKTATDASSGLSATPYYIELATDIAFTQNTQNSGWDADGSWVPGTALSNNTTYYWRVKARDAVGNESSLCGHTADTAGYGSFTTNFVPTNDSMDLLSHADGDILYAGQEYTWQVKVTDADGVTNLQKVELNLDGAASYPVVATWTEATDSFAITTGSAYATTSSTGTDSTVVGNQVTLNFKITLDWDYPNENNGDDRVVSTDDTAATDTDDYTTNTWRLENDLRVTSVACTDNTINPSGTVGTITGYLDYEGVTSPDPPTNCADIRIDPSWSVTNYDDTDLTSAGYFSVASIPGPSSVGAYTYDVDIINPPSGAGTVSTDSNSVTCDQVKIMDINFSEGTPAGGIQIPAVTGRYWFKTNTGVNINAVAQLDYGASAITAGSAYIGHSTNSTAFGSTTFYGTPPDPTWRKNRLENCPGSTVTYDDITIGSITETSNDYGTAVNLNGQNTKDIGWDGVLPTAGTLFWKQLRDANPSWNGSTPYPKLSVSTYVYIDGYTLYYQSAGSTDVNLVVEGASDNLGSVELGSGGYDFPNILGSNPALQPSSTSPAYNISSADSGGGSTACTVYDPVTNTANTNIITVTHVTGVPTPSIDDVRTASGGTSISQITWQADDDPWIHWTVPSSGCGIAGYYIKIYDAVTGTPLTGYADPGVWLTTNGYDVPTDGLPNGKWRIIVKAKDNVSVPSNWSDYFEIWVIGDPDVQITYHGSTPTTQAWYQGTGEQFSFTSANLNNGDIGYYKYVINTSSDNSNSTTDPSSGTQWSSGTLQLNIPNSKYIYVHFKAYPTSGADPGAGYIQHFGPYQYVNTSRLLKHKKFFDDNGTLTPMN